jgi:hypothetical protein
MVWRRTLNKLAIVHWAPIEMYPPAMNLIRYLARGADWDITVYTTDNGFSLPVFTARGVTVIRSGNPSIRNRAAAIGRHLSYYAGTSARLVRDNPQIVMYFEPQSSFPVTVASVFKRFKLFVHHHEYHSPNEFQNRGMRLARLFHVLEQSRLFPQACWISHTNRERLELFLSDNSSASRESARVMPNLPPAGWPRSETNAWSITTPQPLKLVYVGSVSISDTYLKELIVWIKQQPRGRVSLDVFAYNTDDETRRFLEAEAGEIVRFHPNGILYDDLPRTLSLYHTGVILYKANSLNYRHNESNKLFEYLAAGLDVMYPAAMLGVKRYSRLSINPRVIEVDSATGTNLDLRLLSTRPQSSTEPFTMTAETAFAELERELLEALDEREPQR